MGPGLFLGLGGRHPAVVPRRCHESGICKAGVEGETKCFKDSRDHRFRMSWVDTPCRGIIKTHRLLSSR